MLFLLTIFTIIFFVAVIIRSFIWFAVNLGEPDSSTQDKMRRQSDEYSRSHLPGNVLFHSIFSVFNHFHSILSTNSIFVCFCYLHQIPLLPSPLSLHPYINIVSIFTPSLFIICILVTFIILCSVKYIGTFISNKPHFWNCEWVYQMQSIRQ